MLGKPRLTIENEAILGFLDKLPAEFYTIVFKLLSIMKLELDKTLDLGFDAGEILITKDGNPKKWIFCISAGKAVNLDFSKGALIEDPKKLFVGTQKNKRTIHLKEPKQLTEMQAYITELMKKALAFAAANP